MLKVLQSKPILSISIIVILMLAFSIDVVPVSIMEARNFITAREMVTDGNWLLTTMNGEARYEKPPLPTWITAIFGLVFGFKSLVALRFPTIIFISIIGIFTYLLSKKIVNNTLHSFINALIVITSFYVIGIALEAPWDIFAHGFMLIAIYHLFQFFENERKFGIHVFLAGLFIGCSILCKGPIPIYALMLPFILAYAFTFRFKKFKSKLWSVLGILMLALLVGGWWYVYVRMNDPLTFQAITIKETSNWHSYNTKPFYYYWSFFTQSGIWTIPAFIGLLYPYLKNRVSNLKAYQFSLLWTVIAVILLSLVPEKKSRYLMPVLIPLAINTGFYIEYLIRRFRLFKYKKDLIPVYFNFGLIAMISLVLPIVLYKFLDDDLSGHWKLFAIFSVISICIGSMIFIHLKKKNMSQVFMLTIAFFIATFMFALPLVKSLIGIPNRSITSLENKNITIYGFSNVSPEMIWQYGEKIPQIKLEDGSIEFPKENRFGILAYNINDEDWASLQKEYTIEKIDSLDLNTVPLNSKRHNDRLLNDYYLLTRR